MDQANFQTVTFRCPPELEPVLPKPIPAVQGLPDWFKAMPQKAHNPSLGEDTSTVKKCPPFIDAMTYGYLMPLVCDLKVENGAFSWERDVPGGGVSSFSRSPISFHDTSQVVGSPLYDEDRFLIKFNNFWTIAAPPGYSILFTHPVNRPELPFTTITGMVDCDRYTDNFVNFPAHWHDASFSGVLPKGTPVAQCIPIKREDWRLKIEPLTREGAERLHTTANVVKDEFSVYRRTFRAPKR